MSAGLQSEVLPRLKASQYTARNKVTVTLHFSLLSSAGLPYKAPRKFQWKTTRDQTCGERIEKEDIEESGGVIMKLGNWKIKREMENQNRAGKGCKGCWAIWK